MRKTSLKNKALKKRLKFAIAACQSAGEALLRIRDFDLPKRWRGSQLKSAADRAADVWLTSLLHAVYPHEPVLSEEDFSPKTVFKFPRQGWWVLDPLDGTRSYHDGFDGFCVQMAFLKNGKVLLGVVYWPVKKITYWSVKGWGAYRDAAGKTKRLLLGQENFKKIYIDNRPAKGLTAKILKTFRITKFLESGSFGLKICQVAEGKASIFFKAVKYRLWDVAPGQLILEEAGGIVTEWDGSEIAYSGPKVVGKNLIAVSSTALHQAVIKKIAK